MNKLIVKTEPSFEENSAKDIVQKLRQLTVGAVTLSDEQLKDDDQSQENSNLLRELDAWMEALEDLDDDIEHVPDKKAGKILTLMSNMLHHLRKMLLSYIRPKKDAAETLTIQNASSMVRNFKETVKDIRETGIEHEEKLANNRQEFAKKHGGPGFGSGKE